MTSPDTQVTESEFANLHQATGRGVKPVLAL